MTTRPSKNNPTGITSYEIPSALAELPEWQDLAQAMNRCALAGGDLGVTQTQWIAAVRNLASGISFMDCCPECDRQDLDVVDGQFIDTSAAPAITEVTDNWVRGGYVCRNGHTWRCGYGLTSPLYF